MSADTKSQAVTATEIISVFRLCVKRHSPFFSVLAYNCGFVPITGSQIAATDGTKIYFNAEYFSKLNNDQKNAIFLHEILHIAFSHVSRLGSRDPNLWNIACFEKDAPVLTERGYQAISTITPNTKVMTREGSYETVAALLSKEYEGNLVTIKPHGCLEIKATEDHKFLVRTRKGNGKRTPVKFYDPEWKEASELTTNDYLLIPKSKLITDPVIPLAKFLSGERREILKGDIILDIETAWVLGRYLADGSAVSDTAISWAIGASKPQDADRLSKWLYSIGHSGRIVRRKDNTFKVEFNSVAFRKLTEEYFGRGARQKRVPSFMFGQSAELIRSFIEGWQAGDGCKVGTKGRNIGWTSSPNLALGLQRLALSIDWNMSISYTERMRKLPEAEVATLQTGYVLGFYPSTVTSRVLNGRTINSSNKRSKNLPDGSWIPITSVASNPFSGLVYTLNVENSHTYTVWNTVVKNCDITVNYIIDKLPYCKLPDNAVREPTLWRDTTEEIYELLKKDPDLTDKYKDNKDWLADLISSTSNGDKPADQKESTQITPASPQELAEAEALWKDLVEVAKKEQEDNSNKFGNLPAELMRSLELLATPQLNWKQMLMNYLIAMPTDYEGYDRRFISQGLYCDALDGQSVSVDVCIDTSGSISQADLAVFATELLGILVSYPHVDCNLYWADTKAHGPYPIESITDLPKPQGGGGTSFKDFFIRRAENTERVPAPVAIYLTDGYGSFPEPPTEVDTLWICNSDKKAADFPFGIVTHLST